VYNLILGLPFKWDRCRQRIEHSFLTSVEIQNRSKSRSLLGLSTVRDGFEVTRMYQHGLLYGVMS
jgi:hypothetical protein